MTVAEDFWVLWGAVLVVVIFAPLAGAVETDTRAGRLYRGVCFALLGIAFAFALPPLWRLLVLVWQG